VDAQEPRDRRAVLAFVAGFVLAGLAALAAFLFLRHDEASVSEAASAAEAAALHDRLADLERRLADASRRPREVSPPVPTLAPAPPAPPKPSPTESQPHPGTPPPAPPVQVPIQFLSGERLEVKRPDPEHVAAVERIRELAVRDPAGSAREVKRLLESDREEDRDVGFEALSQTRDTSLLPWLVDRVNASRREDEQRRLIEAIAPLKDRKWSAKQAAGAPDTPLHGDLGTAWAPKGQDMGEVRLDLEYERAVRPESVRIHETLNPGAVSRVMAKAPDGTWEVLWEGVARRGEDPAATWFQPPLAARGWATTTIRIVLDTDRVPGWNEIDAVELIGDGWRQWAKDATASSSYAD
jgi:hypothetical protein